MMMTRVMLLSLAAAVATAYTAAPPLRCTITAAAAVVRDHRTSVLAAQHNEQDNEAADVEVGNIIQRVVKRFAPLSTPFATV